MEKKIGEIFEYNGEWYQCVEEILACKECTFRNNPQCLDSKSIRGDCQKASRPNKGVIFKKLEKVGEPRKFGKKLMQNYKVFVEPYTPKELEYFTIKSARDLTILIEIKQNKENMEEEREYSEEEFKNNPRFQHHKPIEQVINMKKMKPFDLQKAKAGKPVCTRDGRKARIICFDRMGVYPIIALVQKGGIELCHFYTEDGKCVEETNHDLMMLPEKKEGWILLRKDGYTFDNEEVAKKNCTDEQFVAKVEWEE